MSLEKDSYERIIENLYDGLYFVDRDRIITYWNKAAEQISGFTANEVVGKPCSDDILTHVDIEGNNLCTGMCPLAATISIGATLVKDNDTIDSLIKRADTLLYESKTSGRNCLTVG